MTTIKLSNLLSTLKTSFVTSRPGLWFATLWLYLLPTSLNYNLLSEPRFWIGFIYCAYPLNLLVYAWNDYVDVEADKHNARKGNWLFGAKKSAQELLALRPLIIGLQIVFYSYFIFVAGPEVLLLLLVQIFVLYLYNQETWGWRSRPPLELSCQIGYLLIIPLSISINGVNNISLMAYIYLSLFALQSHLMGEVMDVTPDRNAGKKTTATVIGRVKTKFLIILLVLAEVLIVSLYFNDFIFGGLLCLGLIWLLVDLFILFKNKEYSLAQMKVFGLGSNLIAVASIIYVWWTGCLLL